MYSFAHLIEFQQEKEEQIVSEPSFSSFQIIIIIRFQKIYGFWGLGQVEVGMLPQRDKRMTNELGKLLSQWTMEG